MCEGDWRGLVYVVGARGWGSVCGGGEWREVNVWGEGGESMCVGQGMG